jgi:hypothetical protein
MNLTKFLKARRAASHPAKFSLRNIRAVWQAWTRRKLFREIDGLRIAQHTYEQIIWRRMQVEKNSPKCWHTGACKVCGCDILGKTMEDRPCSIAEHPELLAKRPPCYPAMMEAHRWEDYKRQQHIKLFEF